LPVSVPRSLERRGERSQFPTVSERQNDMVGQKILMMLDIGSVKVFFVNGNVWKLPVGMKVSGKF